MNEEIKLLLEDLVIWTKLSMRPQVRTTLLELLSDEDKNKTKQLRTAFEATESSHKQEDIAKKSGVSVRTIKNWHSKWYKFGVIRKVGTHWQKIISLSELAIPMEDKNNG